MTSDFDYNPQRRYSRRVQGNSKLDIANYHSILGLPTFEIRKSTLAHTSHLVDTLESETKEYIHNYYKTRVHTLRPHRIDNILYKYTFFSSIPSIRGYTCFQLFAYIKSKYDRLVLMRREVNAPKAYSDVI